jgi:hypothetical protein
MNDELERILKEMVIAKLRQYLNIACWDQIKPPKTSIRIASVLAMIKSQHLQNMSLTNVYIESLLLKHSGMQAFLFSLVSSCYCICCLPN